MPEWISKTLGKVRIERLIARGGMAEVYLGTHTSLERRVAVKVLLSYLESEPELQARFQREARVLAGLRHPSIVQIYDFDVYEGQPYLVMEYVPGTSLSAILREAHKNNGRLTLREAGRILVMIASALDYAHAQGIIHRDVKPANVLVTAPGEPPTPGQPLPPDTEAILTDFGLLRLRDSASQTASGTVSGTPAYMSPEQARGASVDHQSDIYSLGVMLYEILAGRVPFDADTSMGVLMKHIQEPPPPIPDLPLAIQNVLNRSLEKRPQDRYQTAREMARAFLEACGLNLADVAPGYNITPQPGSITAMNTPAFDERATLPPTPPSSPTVKSRRGFALPSWGGWALAGAALLLAGGLALWPRGAAVQQPALAPTPPAKPSPSVAPPTDTPEATKTRGHSEHGGTPQAGDPMSNTMTGEMKTFGLLRFYDVAAFLDEVILVVNELPAPPAGKQYEAWLVGEETRRSLGVLELDASGRGEITFLDDQGRNLLARYDRLEITLEALPDPSPNTSDEVAYSSGIPPVALEHLRHLFVSFSDTPNQTPLIVGLVTETNHIDDHARAMVAAYEAGDEKSVRFHAESIYNLLVGKQGQGYGDLDQDGKVADPGDGYGLLLNGDSLGYIEGTISHTQYAMTMGDGSLNIATHGQHVIISAENMEGWASELRDLMLRIMTDPISDQANTLIRQAAGLADRMRNGRDLNGNEQIEPVPGEGGAKTVLDHAGYMIDMPVMEGAGMIPPPMPSDMPIPTIPGYNDG